MTNEREIHGVVPIPDPPAMPQKTSTKRFRRARRRSRLTAGALIVGSGAAAVTLAYDLIPAATPVAGTAVSTTGVGATAVTAAHGGPQVAHTVATTSASGVTTTTTTQVVNGKTVVTQSTKSGSGSTYHDD